ncbi:MAG: nucleotidyltransferase family protein, partial [bacterium]|nr:nucleotidyltransferase family protein [bacterium]
MPAPLDWRRVLWLASWHRLSGALYRALRSAESSDQIPREILDELADSYDRAHQRYRRQRAELVRVTDVMGAARIPTVLLKGSALVETVYRDPGLRPMGDLDLMVPEDRLDQADRLLRGLGYSSRSSREEQEGTHRHHRHYPRLKSEDGVCELELHRHIVRADSGFHFPVSELWARAQETQIADLSALILSPEDQLVHLSLSFFGDRALFYQSSCALGQLLDIAALIDHHRGILSFDEVAARAKTNNHEGPLLCALWSSSELLRASVPREVLERLAVTSFATARLWIFTEELLLDLPL